MITKKSPYVDLKKWFMDNMDHLPVEFIDRHITYHDLQHSIKLNIQQIDNEISRSGKDVRYSRIAGACKANLFELHQALQKQSPSE